MKTYTRNRIEDAIEELAQGLRESAMGDQTPAFRLEYLQVCARKAQGLLQIAVVDEED